MPGGHCRSGGTALPLNSCFCPRLSSGQGLTDQSGQLCRPCGTVPAHTREMPAGIRLQDREGNAVQVITINSLVLHAI